MRSSSPFWCAFFGTLFFGVIIWSVAWPRSFDDPRKIDAVQFPRVYAMDHYGAVENCENCGKAVFIPLVKGVKKCDQQASAKCPRCECDVEYHGENVPRVRLRLRVIPRDDVPEPQPERHEPGTPLISAGLRSSEPPPPIVTNPGTLVWRQEFSQPMRLSGYWRHDKHGWWIGLDPYSFSYPWCMIDCFWLPEDGSSPIYIFK